MRFICRHRMRIIAIVIHHVQFFHPDCTLADVSKFGQGYAADSSANQLDDRVCELMGNKPGAGFGRFAGKRLSDGFIVLCRFEIP